VGQCSALSMFTSISRCMSQSITKLQKWVFGIKRNVLGTFFHGFNNPREVKYQLPFRFHNAKYNIEKYIVRASIACKRSCYSLSDLWDGCCAPYVNVDNNLNTLEIQLLLSLLSRVILKRRLIIPGRNPRLVSSPITL
jgi:hypothetical protein